MTFQEHEKSDTLGEKKVMRYPSKKVGKRMRSPSGPNHNNY